jgi:hypothetical protein
VEIRLSEDDLTGSTIGGSAAPAYTSNLIAQKGIANTSASADLRRGGDMASYEGVNIALVNAEQLFLALQGCGINLQGCPMQLWEFAGQAGALAGAQIFTGICDDVSWTATGLTVKCKNSRMRRNAPMFTQINNGQYSSVADLVTAVNNNEVTCNYPYANDDDDGKMVPCTFGALDYAKMIRTADMVIPTVINGGGASGSLATVLSLPTDTTQYRYVYPSAPDFGDLTDAPIYGPPPQSGIMTIGGVIYYANQVPIYWLKIGDSTQGGKWQKSTDSGETWADYTTSGAIALTALAGQYITCIDGTGKGSGRLIAAAYFDPSGTVWHTGYPTGHGGSADTALIMIVLASTNFFTDDSGNAVQLIVADPEADPVANTNDSWCQIQAAYQGYAADEWPLEGWN